MIWENSELNELQNPSELSKKVNGEFYLIDGGHRTRTISSYMKNMFAITIDDDKVFYNLPKLPNKKLTNEELYSYFNLEENEINYLREYFS